MASKKNKARSARDANPRKFKKKTSILVIEKTEYVDYKDVDLLRRFMSDRSKIKNRRVAGNDLQQQRQVANAIKVAREMALLPYATRVASTRTGGRRDRDGGRDGGRGRDEGREETTVDAVDTAVDEAVVDQVDVADTDASGDEPVAAGTEA
ncbi:MAG: 30S ribosomal protein S18 [Ilumatobacter sp.]|nr:30S ribosomal protein S18 [Ilumatobacter sp.]